MILLARGPIEKETEVIDLEPVRSWASMGKALDWKGMKWVFHENAPANCVYFASTSSGTFTIPSHYMTTTSSGVITYIGS